MASNEPAKGKKSLDTGHIAQQAAAGANPAAASGASTGGVSGGASAAAPKTLNPAKPGSQGTAGGAPGFPGATSGGATAASASQKRLNAAGTGMAGPGVASADAAGTGAGGTGPTVKDVADNKSSAKAGRNANLKQGAEAAGQVAAGAEGAGGQSDQERPNAASRYSGAAVRGAVQGASQGGLHGAAIGAGKEVAVEGATDAAKKHAENKEADKPDASREKNAALGAGGTSYQHGHDPAQPDQSAESSDSSDKHKKIAAAGAVAAAPPVAGTAMLIAFLNWLKSFFFAMLAQMLNLVQLLMLWLKGAAVAAGKFVMAPFLAMGAVMAKAGAFVFGAGSVFASVQVATASLSIVSIMAMVVGVGSAASAMTGETAAREGQLTADQCYAMVEQSKEVKFTGAGVPTQAIPWVENAASHSEYHIPAAFFAYIMDRETDFRPGLFAMDKNGGTWGLFQMNAEEWGKITDGGTFSSPDIKNPMIHTEYGAKYFDNRLETVRKMRAKNPTAAYARDLTELEALMIAHNAGEGSLKKYPNLSSITTSYLAEFRQKFQSYGGGEPSQTRDGEAPTNTTPGTANPGSSDAEGTTPLNLGAVKPHVQKATELIYSKFKDGVTSVGGYRAGNSVDPNGHPSGLAVDFMVPMTQKGKATGDALAKYAIENAAALNVKYVIWYQRIWNVSSGDTGWRNMSDRGNPTANHMDHPHISFNASGSVTDVASDLDQQSLQDKCGNVLAASGSGAGGFSFNAGGMSREEAQKLIDVYNVDGDTFLRHRYNGGGPGQCHGDYRQNCVSFSVYFLNKYTSFQKYVPGNGVATARTLASLSGKTASKTPTPYSVFSYANGGYGHTGIVLGVQDDGSLIIGNAAYCAWDGRVNIIPAEKWRAKSWDFTDVSDLLTGMPTG